MRSHSHVLWTSREPQSDYDKKRWCSCVRSSVVGSCASVGFEILISACGFCDTLSPDAADAWNMRCLVVADVFVSVCIAWPKAKRGVAKKEEKKRGLRCRRSVIAIRDSRNLGVQLGVLLAGIFAFKRMYCLKTGIPLRPEYEWTKHRDLKQ